jgi:hypothetical protein
MRVTAQSEVTPELTLESVPGSGCSIELENTIVGINDKSQGWLVRVSSATDGGKERTIQLQCPSSAQAEPKAGRVDICRITLRTSGPKGRDDQPMTASYRLKERKRTVLLREPPTALVALRGILGRQDAQASCPWYCRALPGQEWEVAKPSLEELVLGGENVNLLQATISNYGRVSCTWRWGDFFKIFGSVVTCTVLVEVARLLSRWRKLVKSRGGTAI